MYTKIHIQLRTLPFAIYAAFMVSLPMFAQDFVHPTELIVRGHLSADQVEKALASTIDAVTNCYNNLLKIESQAKGKITLVYDVTTRSAKETGCKPKIESIFSNQAFKKCVQKHACNARFPLPKLETHIEYPLVLVPRVP